MKLKAASSAAPSAMNGPQHESGEDPEGQHAELMLARHRERGHDHQEDEEVVDREALLDEVAGKVLRAVVPAGGGSERDPESDRYADVEDGPGDGLAELDHVRAPAGEEEIEREQRRH